MPSPSQSTYSDSILPVIDIQHGLVVRGVAGERERYRPIQSSLTCRADCASIATALRDNFGSKQLYVADLDAIAGAQVNTLNLKRLLDMGFQLLLDAGISNLTEQQQLASELEVDTSSGRVDWVVGLESLRDRDELRQLGAVLGERCILSIDLRRGRPITQFQDWHDLDATQISDWAIDAGIGRIIVLDLAAVGIGEGPCTLELCRRIRAKHADVELISGGGVRNMHDVQSLTQAGCDHVLVASALHCGAIAPACF